MLYKLKHIPTGLYFQPHKHRGSHLSKRGKVYQTKTNGLSNAIKEKTSYFRVQCEKGSHIQKITEGTLTWEPCSWAYNQMIATTKVVDWAIEEIKG